jgi:basic membrane protein A
MVFDTDEAAFLAGYAAAAMTGTGIVGTWGGVNIPPVSIFMDGFLAGVNHYNAVKGADVEVLGWDGSDGVFIGSFEAADLGNAGTTEMLQNGADIIMPVAGPAGLGAATAIEDFGSGTMIWVDTDGYFSTTFGSITLTSVEKKMDNATFDLIQSVQDDTFAGGTYVGTLENAGVGISPFHDFEDLVPDDVKAELDALRAAIIAGELSTSP